MAKAKRKRNRSGTILTIATVLLAGVALISALKSAGIIFSGSGEDGPTNNASSTIEPSETIKPSVTHQTETSAKSPSATPVSSTTAKTPGTGSVRVPGKLNGEELSKLDNKTLAWWIKLNGENKTPETTPQIIDMLAQHEGYYVADTSVKKVYLTFDEGYENGYTPMILDALKANNVKALFFITSGYLKNSADLVKRMVEEGHEVGNHSVNHKSMPSITDLKEFEAEIENLTRDFKNLTGKDMLFFRPPMGEYSERTLEAVSQLGYRTLFWSFAYDDWYVDRQRGADYAYDICMKNIHNGAVYLLHAVSKDNAEALDRIIKGIRAQGYEIGDPLEIGQK